MRGARCHRRKFSIASLFPAIGLDIEGNIHVQPVGWIGIAPPSFLMMASKLKNSLECGES